jgi:hypothetical protein
MFLSLRLAEIEKMTTHEKKNYFTELFKRHWYEVSVKATQDVDNTSKLVIDIISMEATENAILYLNAVKAYMEVFLNVKNAPYKYGVTSFMVGRIVRRSTRAYMIVESALKEYIIAGGDVEVISKANAFAEAVKAYTELESKQYKALYGSMQLWLNEAKAMAEWKEEKEEAFKEEAFAEWKKKNEESKLCKRKADETKADETKVDETKVDETKVDETKQINKKQKRP